jgi:trk system potassium uptake protein TrkA
MKRFLVIGLGQLGYELAKALTEKGAEVIAVDRRMNLVEEIRDMVTTAVSLDSTDEEALKSLKVENVDVAIVAIAEDIQASVLTTALLKELGVENIIARRTGSLHGKILERIGATRIISPEQNVAEQLARSLVSPGLLEHIALPDGQTIFQVEAREEFVGKSLIELDFRRNFGLLVVSIQRKIPRITETGEVQFDTQMISLPAATEAIRKDDILVLVGMKEDIERFLAGES